MVSMLGDLQRRPADCLQLDEVLGCAALELQDDVLCDACPPLSGCKMCMTPTACGGLSTTQVWDRDALLSLGEVSTV